MSRRHTLLVVEDDPDLLEFFRISLSSEGYDVRVARDGLQALRRLDSDEPDAVILDLGLPGLSGQGVLLELAASPYLRRIPVVVVTGTALRPDDPNVFCTLHKPVTAAKLIDAIRRCLQSQGQATI